MSNSIFVKDGTAQGVAGIQENGKFVIGKFIVN